MKLNKLMIALVVMMSSIAAVAQTQVAKIGEDSFASLQAAIDVAEAGQTITLASDLSVDTETYTIGAGKSVVLDMNGKTITVTDNKQGTSSAANYELFYIVDGDLTVTGNGTINLEATYNRAWDAMSVVFHNRGGVLTIKNGTFNHLGGTDMAFVVDNSGNHYGDATTNIYDGTLYSTYTAIRNRMEQNTHGASGKVYLNIYGGNINGGTSAVWAQAASTSTTAPATGEINISGGQVGLVNTARSEGAESMTTITGGTVAGFKGEVGELIVNGGTITGEVTILTSAGEVADYVVDQNGAYVEKTSAVASVGSAMFTNIYEAFAAADGKTVTLLENVELQETLVVTGTTTLDLNGKTISQTKNQTDNYSMIQNDGNLTIVDNLGGGKISYADSGNGGEYVSNTIMNRGTLIVNGGTIENLSSATVATNGYPYAIDSSIWGPAAEVHTIINGGTVYCKSYSALRLRGESKTKPVNITVNGGEIAGCIEVQLATQSAAGKGQLTINGGKVSNTGTANAIFVFGSEGSAENLALSITGGEVSGNVTVKPSVGANFDSQFIAGGTFNTDVTAFCEHWHEVALVDGKYEVAVQNEIALVDGAFTQFANDMDIEVASINYTRTFKNAKVWNAVFLPFEVALSEDFLEKYDVAEWTGVQANVSDDVLESWGIELTKIKDPAAVLQANRPYFIYVKDAKDLTFVVSLTNATLFATDADNKDEHTVDGVMTCTMVGNYKKLAKPELDGAWVVSATGQWIHAGSMNPFRVLMTRTKIGDVEFPNATSSAMRVIIREPNGTTAIEDAVIDAVQDNVVYDLQGRRVANPIKGGVYIVNGKKVVKK